MVQVHEILLYRLAKTENGKQEYSRPTKYALTKPEEEQWAQRTQYTKRGVRRVILMKSEQLCKRVALTVGNKHSSTISDTWQKIIWAVLFHLLFLRIADCLSSFGHSLSTSVFAFPSMTVTPSTTHISSSTGFVYWIEFLVNHSRTPSTAKSLP